MKAWGQRVRLATGLSLISWLVACGAEVGPIEPPAVDTGVDPDTWVTVPAGEFLQGQHEHPTLIDYPYRIMVTDVTASQYGEYLEGALAAGSVWLDGTDVLGPYEGDEFHGGRHELPIEAGDWLHVPLGDSAARLAWDGESVSVVPGYENHPMVLVTWFGAQAYCEAQGGRLPTEDEWEKAARGTDDRPYPWGHEIARDQANFYSSHDLFEKLERGLDTTPVGFYNGGRYRGYQTRDGVSPYGLYDMAGNVWQWAADVHELTHLRTLRGGSKADYAYNLRVWTRNSAGPDYASVNVGFRCVR
jgi:formylglycine-generating enzyme required for sulfatase activity